MSKETQSLARQRIEALLDASSFVEIGAKVTARNTDFSLSEKSMPSDGVITGYGVIDGSLVYVYSQDASVLHGTVGEMHARKIVNLYKMAMKMGAPVIGLIDSAGMRLEESTDALNGFGQIYMAQADASGVIPQITGIFGTCGGGMALVPAMSDFTYMEEKKAKLFVNSPNALEGNIDSVCDTAAAAFQSQEAGMVDGTGTEEEIIASIRKLVAMLPSNNEDDMSYGECLDDLNRSCQGIQSLVADPAAYLPMISDAQTYVECKSAYGTDMVTAFIKLNGVTVGVVANKDAEGKGAVLSARGAGKAAQFVQFCDAFSIPVVTFTNVRGYKATKCSEANMARSVAKLTYAFANATTPKVNVITGETLGSAYLTMNSKSVGADLVFAWTDAKIGMMNAQSAAKIMYEGADAATLKKEAAKYDALHNGVESAARRGYVDTIIAAEDTRKYLIGALEMLFTKREYKPDKKHGTV